MLFTISISNNVFSLFLVIMWMVFHHSFAKYNFKHQLFQMAQPTRKCFLCLNRTRRIPNPDKKLLCKTCDRIIQIICATVIIKNLKRRIVRFCFNGIKKYFYHTMYYYTVSTILYLVIPKPKTKVEICCLALIFNNKN